MGWVDLLIRNVYRECIMDSLRFCMKNKGLNVQAYVIMTSHVHHIVSADIGTELSGIIRGLKKHTSKELIKLIKTIPESRRKCLPVG